MEEEDTRFVTSHNLSGPVGSPDCAWPVLTLGWTLGQLGRLILQAIRVYVTAGEGIYAQHVRDSFQAGCLVVCPMKFAAFIRQDLPLDLLRPILEQLTDRRDWNSCALVSKNFNRVAIPLLYSVLDSRVVSKVGNLLLSSVSATSRPKSRDAISCN